MLQFHFSCTVYGMLAYSHAYVSYLDVDSSGRALIILEEAACTVGPLGNCRLAQGLEVRGKGPRILFLCCCFAW